MEWTAEAGKRCATCGVTKACTEFNRKRSRRDGLQEACRDCNRAASRRYYAENRERHIQTIVARTAKRRREAKTFLAAYLNDHPCVDCGLRDLRVLDFDHRPDSLKRKDVMQMVKEGFGIAAIIEEIAKCDVRCRNCHAIVTLERRPDNWRSQAMYALHDPG